MAIKIVDGEFLSLHNFDGEFIVISLAGDTDEAVLHFSGDQDTLINLLKGAYQSIQEAEIQPNERLH